MIKTHYKLTKVVTVLQKEDGSKELIEKNLTGVHTVKEIKESLPENETFFSKEQVDETLEFELPAFLELREQGLI